jgi:ABC-type hemin transport system ATPase subunit
VALDAPLLVLDEPTVGLDQRAGERVLALLRARRDRDEATLIISHDLALVATLATRVVALGAGLVVADGPPRAVLTDETLLRRAGIAPSVVAHLAATLAPLGVRRDALTIAEFCDSYAAAWRAARTDR